ncbi:hypothetical protein CIHG_10238 [Coccidioides immitis H538.4]|uniref:Aminoglycoside phosphotransferase domain-containing protein n=3 Tax=Coccidioides immitis TaxID=5501 RepID=A0A0J8QMY9_COCIT|nr:hypothetical protein CIRG_05491 [Coccidioides immitis RMSCC 2394]KMU73784.1 hypothetical protein CISG_10183 [Coccidioides immitis RMSCC 3703]KMU92504.1 hypothetical protein CIHG_10238 [Coccidioides immitis H538.4]
MNELLRFGGLAERLVLPKRETYSSSFDYSMELAELHVTHLREQLNIAYDSRAARDRYTCRHLFKSIVPFFTAVDEINGPFKIFCDGLGPGNMLVDPSTLRVTAVIDWEFSYTAPAPPKWLLKKRIAHWVEDEGLEATLESYVPRFNLFLQALEEQEAERYAGIESISGRNRLSMRMRQSLQGRTVWFNSAIRNGWSLDALVWGVLDNHIYGKVAWARG